jgi:hypothetical protein
MAANLDREGWFRKAHVAALGNREREGSELRMRVWKCRISLLEVCTPREEKGRLSAIFSVEPHLKNSIINCIYLYLSSSSPKGRDLRVFHTIQT